jgi:acyl-CoA reductase-like NAD-dependent aldehyde dehydrogenase
LGAAARLIEERVEELARFAALNLMVGNPLVVKHAPGAPQCALAFEKVPARRRRAFGRLPGYRDRDAAEQLRAQQVCAIFASPTPEPFALRPVSLLTNG